MLILRRVLLVSLAIFIAWRIMSFGISKYYLGKASKASEDDDALAAVDRALVWNQRHPDALYRKFRLIDAGEDEDESKEEDESEDVSEDDGTDSTDLLRRSIVENPADALPLLALIDEVKDTDDREQADALMDASAELMPVHPSVLFSVGRYWAERENIGKALAHWSQALIADKDLGEHLFPSMLVVAENQEAVHLFRPMAKSPPPWWGPFFRYVAGNAQNLETIKALYDFRHNTEDEEGIQDSDDTRDEEDAAEAAVLMREETGLYALRLMREGRVTEAYLTWMSGLSPEEQEYLGVIHNGSFEIEPTNAGFDWYIKETERVVADTSVLQGVAGVDGKQVMHLLFRHREDFYWHLHQPLFLDPGPYQVTGKARVELDSMGGLKWIVRCLRLPSPTIIGESDRFMGMSDWRDFSFPVEVPTDCVLHELRLVSAGTYKFEHEMSGDIWFENMSMYKDLSALEAKDLEQMTGDGAEAEDAGSWLDTMMSTFKPATVDTEDESSEEKTSTTAPADSEKK